MEALKTAKWIANSSEAGLRSHLLRKTFYIKDNISRAVLRCCGLGQAVYHINGKNITDQVLVTHFTRYDISVIYNTFDVTDFITVGNNAIGVHLGNGFYNDHFKWGFNNAIWRAHPKLILELEIEYPNGETELIISDSTWLACDGPIVFNMMRSGEIYDARLCKKGWDTVQCDENDWHRAFICRGAGGKLRTVDMPPIRVVESIKPVKISEDVYDLGQNISGWIKVRVKGACGSEITMKFGELINSDGTLNDRINMLAHEGVEHIDKYILSGNGIEEYEPSFVYHGFRYVQIGGDAQIVDLTARVVHNDFDIIGDFECSDDMLNKIHSAARRSTLTNYMDMPTDCPHREQLGWTGDALISCEQSLMNYDIVKAYKKWMQDFKDAQRPNGQLPGVVPTAGWGYNWGSGPAWDSAIIMIPWQVYQNTGDKTLIEDMWDNMELYMSFMASMADDYIVNYGLGDWCAPDYDACPAAVTDTCFYYANSLIMAKCARLLNRKDLYTDLAKKIKTAYRKRFLDNDKLVKSQTFIACGIYYGLYNDDEVKRMADKLARLVIDNDYHIDCGVLGTKCIFGALSENGYAEALYKMITNPTAPSYAYWINDGMTTLCEQWGYVDRDGQECSRNHHMFSEVDNWFYKYIAGIRIDENGIVIEPCFVDEIEWVKAHHRDIQVEWNKEKICIKTEHSLKAIIKGKEYMIEKGEHSIWI